MASGLHTGQVLHLDGTDWRVQQFIAFAGGKRDVILEAIDGSESVTVPLPRVRDPYPLGRVCLADQED